MKELDVVLTGYLDRRFESAGASERSGFLKLLDLQDPELYKIILGRIESDDAEIRAVLRVLHEDAAPPQP
jgi:succinate dehydrogenase flavin-adding protein (antitoxin of CptAB toxin-antitoxin module)